MSEKREFNLIKIGDKEVKDYLYAACCVLEGNDDVVLSAAGNGKIKLSRIQKLLECVGMQTKSTKTERVKGDHSENDYYPMLYVIMAKRVIAVG